jgi:hypothetical protein
LCILLPFYNKKTIELQPVATIKTNKYCYISATLTSTTSHNTHALARSQRREMKMCARTVGSHTSNPTASLFHTAAIYEQAMKSKRGADESQTSRTAPCAGSASAACARHMGPTCEAHGPHHYQMVRICFYFTQKVDALVKKLLTNRLADL